MNLLNYILLAISFCFNCSSNAFNSLKVQSWHEPTKYDNFSNIFLYQKILHEIELNKVITTQNDSIDICDELKNINDTLQVRHMLNNYCLTCDSSYYFMQCALMNTNENIAKNVIKYYQNNGLGDFLNSRLLLVRCVLLS